MEEARVFVRMDVPLMVKYKVLEEPEVEARSVCDDISEGGIRFPIDERLSPGSSVKLDIDIPFDSMPISSEGVIIWQKKLDVQTGKWHYEIGIKFTEMDSFDKKRLVNFLENQASELIR